MLATLAMPLCGTAADDPYATGIAQYNARQYQQATKTFALALQRQPRNVSACYYLANSYYQLGQLKAAAQYYQWISANFPKSREAVSANVALLRMNVTTGSAGQTSSLATTPGARTASAHSSAGSVDSMFRIVKPLGDHTPCTQAFIDSVKNAIKQCPPNVVAYVASKGCKICLTPTLIDRNPELKNTRPRGYEDGHTYKNTPAMFDQPEVVVCQYSFHGDGEDWEPLDDVLGPLRHEFGHAVDAFLGHVSYTTEFRHIYYLDLGGMEPEAKDTLAYFVQSGTSDGGPSECYAEACSIIFGGSPNKWRAERQTLFKQKFPGVLKYIKAQLASIN